MTEILAIGDRKNNAQAIRDAHALGYINGDVLDATYGKGRFWKLYRPERTHFFTNDIDVSTEAYFHHDFTRFPHHWAGEFDTVVFDPPYKLNGTGGSHPSDAGYGVANKGKDRMNPIFEGMRECERVLAYGGHLLVKCQDQVVSGHKVWQTIDIAVWGMTMFLRLEDQLHVRSYRPQPAGRRQLHARQDYSTLLVFRKGRS